MLPLLFLLLVLFSGAVQQQQQYLKFLLASPVDKLLRNF